MSDYDIAFPASCYFGLLLVVGISTVTLWYGLVLEWLTELVLVARILVGICVVLRVDCM
jgi:hypothetical protein